MEFVEIVISTQVYNILNRETCFLEEDVHFSNIVWKQKMIKMKIQPINYRYHEVEIPQLVIDMFKEATCTDGCRIKEGPECPQDLYENCLTDFISDNIGYFLEDAHNKLTVKGWAIFLMEWFRFSRTNRGHFLSCFNDITIEDKTYRNIWFGWTEDLGAGNTGYIVSYETTNHG